MNVIEFQTYIDQGTIEVPSQYLSQVKGRARIIILTDESDEDGDMVEYLLEHPYQVKEFKPLMRDEVYERY